MDGQILSDYLSDKWIRTRIESLTNVQKFCKGKNGDKRMRNKKNGDKRMRNKKKVTKECETQKSQKDKTILNTKKEGRI